MASIRFPLSTLSTILMQAVLEGNQSTGTNAVTAQEKPVEPPVPEGMKSVTFHFRKEKIKAEDGSEVEIYKHPSVKIPLPIPTREEVLAIFNAPATGDGNRGTEQKFILDLIDDAFYKQAREQINEFRETSEAKTTVTANALDYNKLNITALANMPPSERGSKIDEETMKDFLADYTAVMPEASGKDASKIKAQAGILEKSLRTVKTDKKVLKAMQDFLTIWAGNTQNLEEHQEVYDFLTGRIDRWMKAEPRNVFESIV